MSWAWVFPGRGVFSPLLRGVARRVCELGFGCFRVEVC